MEAVRKIWDFRRLIYGGVINKPYFRQDDITPEGKIRNSKSKNDGNIIIKQIIGVNKWQLNHHIKIKTSL